MKISIKKDYNLLRESLYDNEMAYTVKVDGKFVGSITQWCDNSLDFYHMDKGQDFSISNMRNAKSEIAEILGGVL